MVPMTRPSQSSIVPIRATGVTRSRFRRFGGDKRDDDLQYDYADKSTRPQIPRIHPGAKRSGSPSVLMIGPPTNTVSSTSTMINTAIETMGGDFLPSVAETFDCPFVFVAWDEYILHAREKTMRPRQHFCESRFRMPGLNDPASFAYYHIIRGKNVFPST